MADPALQHWLVLQQHRSEDDHQGNQNHRSDKALFDPLIHRFCPFPCHRCGIVRPAVDYISPPNSATVIMAAKRAVWVPGR